MDVPSRQIGPSAFPEILMLDPHGSAGSGRQTSLLTAARLNTGFFVRRDDELRTLQGFALPDSGVEIQNASGFASEIRIPRKDPTSMLPGTNGIGAEPTPECGAADLGDYALADIGQGQPRERQPEAMRQFTGERLYLYDDVGGKRGQDGRLEVVLQGPADEPVQIVCATCSRSGAECLGAPR